MAGRSEEVIWEGSTWPACCLSPLCCSSTTWKITSRRIDYSRGCCGSDMETLDVRRITDLRFTRSCAQMCTCRGTLTIMSGDESDPVLRITTFGMQRVFERLKEAWSDARQTVAVDIN